MSNASSGLYTIGRYRLDAASRVLTRSGEVVTLAPKTFDLLILMAESDGRLLSKRELMEALWNGTFVEEANLSFQMSSLRKALGEEGNSWIEAVPKHGYRFKAPVERSAVADDPRTDGIPAAVGPTLPRTASRVWLLAGVAAAVVVALGLAAWLFWPRKQRTVAPLHVVPVTSYPGREIHPSFAPDGSQIAFAWDGEKESNFGIYVKVVGENRALKLTSDPRPEFSPVWSPDGRRIAFCREGESGGEIVLIPALGGPERIAANLPKQVDPGHPGRPLVWFSEQGSPDIQLAWFPDGQSLAVVGRRYGGGPNTIFLLSVDDGEMRPLTSPPDRSWGDGSPSVSPDGRALAFIRCITKYPGLSYLYVLRLSDQKLPSGKPQQITPEEIDFFGLAWTSDGHRLVFPSGRRLFTVTLGARIAEPLTLPGYNPTYPAISAKGDRLAFVHSSDEDLDIWRVVGPKVMHERSGAAPPAPIKLISSTQLDTTPQYSPDGSRVAFTSSRAGTLQIWICDSDGSNPVQLTNLQPGAATPRWSPDGRYIAFDSDAAGPSSNIYVIPAQGGRVRRIAPENSTEDMASWSRDGKWIYFESDRSGVFQIWKVPFAGGTPVQVTDHGGADAFESLDGKFVYYAKWEQRGIWRKPVNGGPEALVTNRGTPYHWGLFDEGVCLINRDSGESPTLDCLNFNTNGVTTIAKLPKNTRINEGSPSFSVSRDGRSILYVTVERAESDIMMVDNFR